MSHCTVCTVCNVYFHTMEQRNIHVCIVCIVREISFHILCSKQYLAFPKLVDITYKLIDSMPVRVNKHFFASLKLVYTCMYVTHTAIGIHESLFYFTF